MDEKSMILEQERQAKAKKRKKRRKLKIIIGIIVLLLLAGGIFYLIKGRELLAASQTNAVEIVAEEGQTIVYAQIVSIYGNEITYIETQMPQMNITGDSESKENSEGSGSMSGMPEGFGGAFPEGFGGEMPEGFSGGFPEGFGGEMPEGFSGGFPEGFGGEMPEGFEGGFPEGFGGGMPGESGGRGQRGNLSGSIQSQGAQAVAVSTSASEESRLSSRGFSGGMPEGFSGGFPEGFSGEMPEGFGGEMPEGFSGGMPEGFGGEMPEGFSGELPESFGGNNGSQEQSEQITAYIPVGTEVITKLGTTTTFSRLAAGDYVALVMEEEDGEQIIMAVYIVG